MARVNGPLFSQNARGDIGGALRYQKRGNTNYVKKLNYLPSSMSAKQRTWRLHYKEVWDKWPDLGLFAKMGYIIIAANKGWVSGQHAYLFLNL